MLRALGSRSLHSWMQMLWARCSASSNSSCSNCRRSRSAAQQDDGPGLGEENGLPGDEAGAAAQRTIRVTGGSVGRMIGGALIMPRVSSVMGSLLLRLSYHVPLLGRILAHRPTRASRPLWGTASSIMRMGAWRDMTVLDHLG